MSIFSNIGYIVIGFIGIASIFLIVLTLLEKKLHIRFIQSQFARNEFYIKRISQIKVSDPVEALRTLEHTSQAFFREAFHIKGNPEFSELIGFFKKRNNQKATQFCEEIIRFLYSKDKIDNDKLRDLAALLAEVISKNQIITKERKAELDEKSRKFDPIKHINIPLVKKKISYTKKKKSEKEDSKDKKPEEKKRGFGTVYE